MKTKKITAKEIDKVLELKEKGLSLRDIASVVKISHETVSKIIKKYKKVENK